VPVTASVDVGAVRDAAIVLLCVKTVDTELAAAALVPHLASGASVVSLQNGVDNLERIRAAAGIDAVAAVVYVAAEMAAPGHVKQEVIAVGRAAGVRFPEVDLFAAVDQLGEAMANATSSTAQDIARGKHTEIDALNGYVARRGAELGVATPVNGTLHALVKLL